MVELSGRGTFYKTNSIIKWFGKKCDVRVLACITRKVANGC
jgi:hypothetical protein